jgi:hypothetical protein
MLFNLGIVVSLTEGYLSLSYIHPWNFLGRLGVSDYKCTVPEMFCIGT